MSNQVLPEPEYTPKDMDEAIRLFHAKKIPVYEPGQDDYERYIATANLVYRFSSPPCVVQPKCACDVRDVIRIAKPRKIPITIKNGGHSYAGGSTAHIGILMELSLMNEVSLDEKQENVTVKGGALWFHVYKKLVSKRMDGFVVNGGRCPTVGVSGFMLGGGLSPFTRSFGMGCDTVKEFTIVTADGDEVTVSERDPPKSDKGKLFWALRGAGGGNFGVVVETKIAVKQLKSKFVVAGRLTWYPKKTEEAMKGFMTTMNSFYTKHWSNEMTIDSTWLCELGDEKAELGVRFPVYYNGEETDFKNEISGWTLPGESAVPEHEELKTLIQDRSLQEKSTRFLHETLAAQWIEETKKSLPTNRAYQIYTSFVFQNDPEKIESITKIIREEFQAFRDKFKGDKGLLQVTFIHSGGAANNKRRKETAFRWRGCVYNAYIMLQWEDKWLEKNMRIFLDNMKPKLSPFAMEPGATFINFPDDTLTKEAHEESYYGKNHLKLRRVKKIWDKDNYFKWSQGISLPAQVASDHDDEDANQDDDDAEALSQLIANDALLMSEEALTDVLAEKQWESFYRSAMTELDLYGGGGFPTLVTL
ncbi:hypothetical protein FDECE_17104 [Fusarium decemcellulare]|nr:hypothetical protein FDECE_17104 [Fusarium decemcellulare]